MRHQIIAAAAVCAVLSALSSRHVSAEETKHNPAATPLVTKVYQVADLVHFSPESTSSEKSLENLIALIQSNAASDSWSSKTGGTIQPHASTLSVIIQQTRKHHAEVASFIADLRKLQSDRQILMEVRLIEIPQELGREWVAERLFDEESAAKHRDELISHKGTVVRFAPKITLFQSQMGSIQASPAPGHPQPANPTIDSGNVTLAFRANESADQQSIELAICIHELDADALDVFRAASSHTIPTGHTLVIPVLTKEQQTNPLMNPVFLAKNGIKPGAKTEQPRLVLWITPSVISEEDSESLLGQK